MTYKTLLDTIWSGLTYLSQTGLTNIIYIKYELEDLMELDPQSYPGSQQSGKSVWICPIPMTIDSETIISYGARIYVAQQIREDFADRFQAFSDCIQVAKMFMEWLPANINGLVYPINITPILMFDATVDGIYFDIQIKNSIECLV